MLFIVIVDEFGIINVMEMNIHEALEREIAELGREVESIRNQPEAKYFERKELVRRSLQSVVSQQAVSPPPDDGGASAKESEFLPDYWKGEDVDAKSRLAVEQLVDRVFHKGLISTLKESKKYPPAVQDAFHDVLVDKLMPELEKRKLI